VPRPFAIFSRQLPPVLITMLIGVKDERSLATGLRMTCQGRQAGLLSGQDSRPAAKHRASSPPRTQCPTRTPLPPAPLNRERAAYPVRLLPPAALAAAISLFFGELPFGLVPFGPRGGTGLPRTITPPFCCCTTAELGWRLTGAPGAALMGLPCRLWWSWCWS